MCYHLIDMRLNYAITCDNAFTDSNGHNSIIQIFEKIRAQEMPAIYPRFVVITNFSFEKNTEKDQQYTQLLEVFYKETNEKLAELNISATPSAASTSLNFIGYFVGMKFDKFGQYEIKIKLNGGEVRVISLMVESDSAANG